MNGAGRIVVIGVGNDLRRDDGAGPAVLARLGKLAPPDVELMVSDGEPTDLVEAWTGASLAIVVDAMAGGPDRPGRLHRIVACGHQPSPAEPGLAEPGPGEAGRAGQAAWLAEAKPGPASSHGLGLETAIGLSAALGRMPARLVVHVVQGTDFGHGAGLSAPVAEVIDDLVAAVLAEIGPDRA